MQVSAANAQAMQVPLALSQSQSVVKGAAGSDGQAKMVAQQFEAIMLRQFLSKSVSSMMDSDNSPSGDVYGYFLTDTLATQLAQGGGLGLSKVLQKQFTQGAQSASAQPAVATKLNALQ